MRNIALDWRRRFCPPYVRLGAKGLFVTVAVLKRLAMTMVLGEGQADPSRAEFVGCAVDCLLPLDNKRDDW